MTSTVLPAIDAHIKQTHIENTKKQKKRERLPNVHHAVKLEHYKTIKAPEKDYRDVELEKFSTFITSHSTDKQLSDYEVKLTNENNANESLTTRSLTTIAGKMSVTAKEEKRVETLSKPKSVPGQYRDDRRSVYWIDSAPPTPGPDGVTVIAAVRGPPFDSERMGLQFWSLASKRVQELAQHRIPRQYVGDRPTPIWPVKQTALEREASQRIEQLAAHKTAHPEHAMDRTAYMEVTPGAKRAASTERLEMLSRPKMRQDRFGMIETEWGQFFPVSTAAKKANPTERIESLSEPKKYHTMFQSEKPIQWPVQESAMKAIASLEIQKLARPRSRTMIKDDYDPYKVTLAARRARATPRLDELCAPLPRKCRAKKVA